jgi:hypothetical protein
MAVGALAWVVGGSTLLAGCGSTGPGVSTGATSPGASSPAASSPSGSPTVAAPSTPAVKDLTPGNCTLYPKATAVTLLGGVNVNNNSIDISTGGGTKIDVCSYLDAKAMTDLQGVSYAVVRYDTPATAFAEAQKVQADMLGTAARNNWPVQSLTTPAPGGGQVLGGYGSKTDQGVTYTIAVVGTNVGPYLVVALGASTESVDHSKAFALNVFQALSSAAG